MVKTKEELASKIGEMTHSEVQKLQFISEMCLKMAERKTIDEDTLNSLNNMFAEITIIKDTYTRRLINLLKQHAVVD